LARVHSLYGIDKVRGEHPTVKSGYEIKVDMACLAHAMKSFRENPSIDLLVHTLDITVISIQMVATILGVLF
jgi:hypothetical protein